MPNAIECLRRRAENDGSKGLLVCEGATLTAADFVAKASSIAAGLRERGVAPGDRVAILSARHDESFLTVFAAWFAGAVPVLVNTSLPTEAQRACVATATPVAVVLGQGVGVGSTMDAAYATLAATPADEDDGSTCGELLCFTSGSTGVPKAVRLSVDGVSTNATLTAERLGFRATDVVLINTPPYYISGLIHFLTTLVAGGTLVAVRGFVFGTGMIDLVRQHGVTCFGGAPTHLARLADTVEGTPETTLRLFVSSGDHLPPTVASKVRERFPNVALWVLYGLTEVSGRLCVMPPDAAEAHEGSVGKPLPGMTVAVRRDDGSVAAPRELGEVYVQGPLLMREYFGRPDATAQSLTEWGYRTGDYGYVDEDGFLYLRGRKDGVFKSGAEKISTLLIQETIASIDGVLDSAVLAVDDPFLGKVPVAFLVLRDGTEAGLEAVKKRWRELLPSTHWPKRWRLLEAIPRTGSGKAEGATLRSIFAQGLEANSPLSP